MAKPGRQARFLALGALIAFARVAAAGAAEIAASVSPAAKTDTADPRIFAIRPIAGPSVGGTNATVYGSNFVAGATVEIGTAAATGITVPDAHRINAASPALPPGSVNDIVVTVPGKPAVTLNGAWFVRFTDVPTSYLFARPIEKLRRKGITTGCGGGNYCPNDSVTRAQMAIFILRGKHGSTYHPPPATGTVFNDVPKTAFGADWIEQFASEGITTGCGVKLYCPNNSVTRGEMAVFLLRAKHGSTHNPPAPIGFFDDVTTTTPFAKWIEQLAGEAITSGCGGGNYCPTGPSTRGEMAVFLTKTFARNPQEVIADDLAAGAIDYETSLLYRFYALFSDGRLPARYQTAPSDGEDAGLYEEAELVFPDLSAAGQSAVAPFLARPDDPASPFGPEASSLTQRRANDGEEATRCASAWIGTSRPGSHFRIHLCASGDDTADDKLRDDVNKIADDLWDPMTKAPPAGMGPPLGDCYTPSGGSEICPGGDAKTDVYVLDVSQCRDRNEHCWPLSSTGVARAVSCEPMVGNAKSGYMLLAKARASNAATIKSDFAHEFFHVLQFAHNRAAMAVDTGVVTDGERVIVNAWYVESSATWAEWNFVPASAPDEVHWRFEEDFQPSHASLRANFPSEHPYAAYIWSFFSQQEKGGPAPIFEAWVAAEAATTPEGITDAVDQQLPFATHFRDFAVRNWNVDLAGHPIPKLYKDLKASDGTSPPFPTANPPYVNVVKLPATGADAKLHVRTMSLAAQYDEISFEADVKKIVLKFDKLPAAIDVDLLLEIAGSWSLVKVNKSNPVVYCRDHEAEKVNRIIVVSSNHDKTPDVLAQGDYTVSRKPSCCGELVGVTAFKARVTANYSFSAQSIAGAITRDFDTSQQFDFSGTIETDRFSTPGEFGLSDIATGTASEHDKVVSTVGSSVFTSTQDGDGPIQQGSIVLNLDLDKCTFTFLASTGLEVSNGQPGSFFALLGRIHAKGPHSLTGFTDKLAGGMSFPAHSEDYAFTNPDKDAYVVGGLGSTWFYEANAENNGGTAQVTWTFEPDPPLTNATARPDAEDP